MNGEKKGIYIFSVLFIILCAIIPNIASERIYILFSQILTTLLMIAIFIICVSIGLDILKLYEKKQERLQSKFIAIAGCCMAFVLVRKYYLPSMILNEWNSLANIYRVLIPIFYLSPIFLTLLWNFIRYIISIKQKNTNDKLKYKEVEKETESEKTKQLEHLNTLNNMDKIENTKIIQEILEKTTKDSSYLKNTNFSNNEFKVIIHGVRMILWSIIRVIMILATIWVITLVLEFIFESIGDLLLEVQKLQNKWDNLKISTESISSGFLSTILTLLFCIGLFIYTIGHSMKKTLEVESQDNANKSSKTWDSTSIISLIITILFGTYIALGEIKEAEPSDFFIGSNFFNPFIWIIIIIICAIIFFSIINYVVHSIINRDSFLQTSVQTIFLLLVIGIQYVILGIVQALCYLPDFFTTLYALICYNSKPNWFDNVFKVFKRDLRMELLRLKHEQLIRLMNEKVAFKRKILNFKDKISSLFGEK